MIIQDLLYDEEDKYDAPPQIKILHRVQEPIGRSFPYENVGVASAPSSSEEGIQSNESVEQFLL